MDITGCIKVSEDNISIFDVEDDVSMVMKDNDDPLNMDEDENIYIEDNPKILGIFISRNNIPLLQKVLELIDEYEPELFTEDIHATFIPDKEYIDMIKNSMDEGIHAGVPTLPWTNNVNKEDI